MGTPPGERQLHPPSTPGRPQRRPEPHRNRPADATPAADPAPRGAASAGPAHTPKDPERAQMLPHELTQLDPICEARARLGRMARAIRPGPERPGESLPGTGNPALGHTHQTTESEDIGTERSRKKADTMTAQATTPRTTTATILRGWIIAGLGALILLVVFMLHGSPASASQATAAARPCATSATPPVPCPHPHTTTTA
jgi:hypothetical protein